MPNLLHLDSPVRMYYDRSSSWGSLDLARSNEIRLELQLELSGMALFERR